MTDIEVCLARNGDDGSLIEAIGAIRSQDLDLRLGVEFANPSLPEISKEWEVYPKPSSDRSSASFLS